MHHWAIWTTRAHACARIRVHARTRIYNKYYIRLHAYANAYAWIYAWYCMCVYIRFIHIYTCILFFALYTYAYIYIYIYWMLHVSSTHKLNPNLCDRYLQFNLWLSSKFYFSALPPYVLRSGQTHTFHKHFLFHRTYSFNFHSALSTQSRHREIHSPDTYPTQHFLH